MPAGKRHPDAASLRKHRKPAAAAHVEETSTDRTLGWMPFDLPWLEAQEAFQVLTGGSDQLTEHVGSTSWRAWNAAALMTWCIWLTLTLLVYAVAYPHRGRPEQERAGSSDPQKVMSDGHFHCLLDYQVCIWACCCPSLRWADTVSLSGFASFWVAFAAFSVLSLLNYMNTYLAAVVVFLTGVGFVFSAAKFIEAAAPEHLDKDENNDALKWTIVAVSVLLLGVAVISLGDLLYTLLWSSAASAYMGYLGCFTWGAFTTFIMVIYRQGLRKMLSLPYGNFSTLAFDWCFVFWCPWCAIAQEARAVSDAYKAGHPSVRSGPAADIGPSYGIVGLPP